MPWALRTALYAALWDGLAHLAALHRPKERPLSGPHGAKTLELLRTSFLYEQPCPNIASRSTRTVERSCSPRKQLQQAERSKDPTTSQKRGLLCKVLHIGLSGHVPCDPQLCSHLVLDCFSCHVLLWGGASLGGSVCHGWVRVVTGAPVERFTSHSCYIKVMNQPFTTVR